MYILHTYYAHGANSQKIADIRRRFRGAVSFADRACVYFCYAFFFAARYYYDASADF